MQQTSIDAQTPVNVLASKEIFKPSALFTGKSLS